MNEPEKWFKGRNLFITIEWVSSYVILIELMVIIMLGLFDLIWIFSLILFIFLLGFIAIQQYVYRIHSEKYAGCEILDAQIDVDYDIFEELLLPLAEIHEFPEISPSARTAVETFVDQMQKVYDPKTKIDFRMKIQELDHSLSSADALPNKTNKKKEKGKKKNVKAETIQK